MAVRTIDTNVKLVLGRHYDTAAATDLTGFIATASSVVDDVVTCAAGLPTPFVHTAAKLELIERWLAAHFYLHEDQIAQSEKTDDASITYQGKTDEGLRSTQYGRTAIVLDSSGCLRKIDKGSIQVGMTWLGKRPSEQVDYVERD